jgi:hypothetical protein
MNAVTKYKFQAGCKQLALTATASDRVRLDAAGSNVSVSAAAMLLPPAALTNGAVEPSTGKASS